MEKRIPKLIAGYSGSWTARAEEKKKIESKNNFISGDKQLDS